MITQPPAENAISKVDKLKVVLSADSVQQQFRNAMGENSGAFIASLIDIFVGDDYLQNCDPSKVVAQALKGAILKLPITKSLGFAYIVAYNGVAEFQIGYKGLIQLAIRSGAYKTLNVDEVFEGEYSLKNKLTGVYDLNGTKTSDTVIGYFAHMELQNGFSKTLYMTVNQVKAHAQKYSKSYGNTKGPWVKEFPAMAKKTVLRNLLSHWGLLSVDMQSAMENDDEAANQVANEIASKGNAQPFVDAEYTDMGPGNGQQTPSAQQFEQPSSNGANSRPF